MNNLDAEIVSYLRVTSSLEIFEARSGHTGMALSAAPLAYAVYKSAFLRPSEPHFISRDRIVFSAGHASSLYYALLNLFGYDCTIDDLHGFRRLGSRTAGHPEPQLLDGVDAQTGPLGQGVAMSVGMAIAEDYLRNKYSRDRFSPVSHYTYCIVGDGCLMEGVAMEAISLAGRLKLNKLIVLYDRNNMTIEGNRDLACNENVDLKFKACGFSVLHVKDGNNVSAIEKAILKAQKSSKPTLIIVDTVIGFGSVYQGNKAIHGKALNRQEIDSLKLKLSYNHDDYVLPDECKVYIDELLQKKDKQYQKYEKNLALYKAKYPKEYAQIIDRKEKSVDMSKFLKKFSYNEVQLDFRQKGHDIFNLLYDICPNMIGGTADLAPSTRCYFDKDGFFNNDRKCRNIAFGIREHAMAAICNGISLHNGDYSFCSTFLTFANYMTPAVRLSCMMNLPVLYYFTHDSLAVGEDGPTHQPVEQLSELRSMPNMHTFRPCGEREMLAGMQIYLNNKCPVTMVLPRQKLDRVEDSFENALKGGYVITSTRAYDITLVASGSEVPMCFAVAELLKNRGIRSKIVSMPCPKLFDEQPKDYRDSVINRDRPVFCIEMSSDNVWYKYASSPSNVYLLSSFGKSGEYKAVLDEFGFTPEAITKYIAKNLK